VKLASLNLGLLSWRESYSIQKSIHERVIEGEFDGVICFVEHYPVITFGHQSDQAFLISNKAELLGAGIEVEESDRGGQVTAHEPGQLVVYPILALSRLKLSPKNYVHLLEESVILTLAAWGVAAHRDKLNPGVWVGSQKICAIGIRISRRVSLHGLALNVSNGLNLFHHIVPCGIKGRGITSLSLQMGRSVSLMEVANELGKNLETLLFGGEASIEKLSINFFQKR
jgi:lipoyl(octanoyl) transferase